MGCAIEVAPAPTIFATDIEVEPVDGIDGLLRFTIIEDVHGERRIVAYMIWPVAALRRTRPKVTAALVALERPAGMMLS